MSYCCYQASPGAHHLPNCSRLELPSLGQHKIAVSAMLLCQSMDIFWVVSPSQWQWHTKVYRNSLTKHVIILVTTISGNGKNPRYIPYNLPKLAFSIFQSHSLMTFFSNTWSPSILILCPPKKGTRHFKGRFSYVKNLKGVFFKDSKLRGSMPSGGSKRRAQRWCDHCDIESPGKWEVNIHTKHSQTKGSVPKKVWDLFLQIF